MKDTPIGDRRNFVLMGHTGAGKTTLVDSILHKLGVSNQQGHVDDGTSAADITDEEKEKKFTIWAKPFTGIYKTKAGASVKMTMLDTPGYRIRQARHGRGVRGHLRARHRVGVRGRCSERHPAGGRGTHPAGQDPASAGERLLSWRGSRPASQ